MKATSHIRTVASLLGLVAVVLFSGCGYHNADTPAGYAGYLTQGYLLFGQTKYVGVQTGPTSSGLGWCYQVTNVSVTPFLFSETFVADQGTGVLTKDQLPISASMHIVFQIDPDHVREFMEHYATPDEVHGSDALVQDAYANYVHAPARSAFRHRIEQYDAIEVQAHLSQINDEILADLKGLTENTPFHVRNVVLDNFQYPPKVSDAIAAKIAAGQELQTMAIQVQIAGQEAQKKVTEARGLAQANQIINNTLTPSYLQYEAIRAQMAMVGSPNHTTIYIPVGPMGVPVVQTLNQEQDSGGAVRVTAGASQR